MWFAPGLLLPSLVFPSRTCLPLVSCQEKARNISSGLLPELSNSHQMVVTGYWCSVLQRLCQALLPKHHSWTTTAESPPKRLHQFHLQTLYPGDSNLCHAHMSSAAFHHSDKILKGIKPFTSYLRRKGGRGVESRVPQCTLWTHPCWPKYSSGGPASHRYWLGDQAYNACVL